MIAGCCVSDVSGLVARGRGWTASSSLVRQRTHEPEAESSTNGGARGLSLLRVSGRDEAGNSSMAMAKASHGKHPHGLAFRHDDYTGL